MAGNIIAPKYRVFMTGDAAVRLRNITFTMRYCIPKITCKWVLALLVRPTAATLRNPQ